MSNFQKAIVLFLQVGCLYKNIQETYPITSNKDYLPHRGSQAAGFCWSGLTQARFCTGCLHDAWIEMSHSIPLALNKSPLSACYYCFSLDSSYEAISRKQESALSSSAYWTSPALFSLWGLISRQHNLPIDCCPSFSPEAPIPWLPLLFCMSLAIPNWLLFIRTCMALVKGEKRLLLS